MKFLSIFFLNFLLLSIPVFAEKIPNKSDILIKNNECRKVSERQICRKLIFQLEKLQLSAFESNKFKCQTSLLGLQTELVEAYFFENIQKSRNEIMIPYVIKNC